MEFRKGIVFAGGHITVADLIAPDGVTVYRRYDRELIKAYVATKRSMQLDDNDLFSFKGDSLYSFDGSTAYILVKDVSEDVKAYNEAAKSDNTRAFADGEIDVNDLNEIGTYEVTDDFYRFLASMDEWRFARGDFENAMRNAIALNS